jgi:hypothetical protein
LSSRCPSASSASSASAAARGSSATSWLSKTFKRAFAVNSDGTYAASDERPANEMASRKLVIPQVQITEDGSKNFWGSNGVHPAASPASTVTSATKVSDKIAKDKKKKKSIK